MLDIHFMVVFKDLVNKLTCLCVHLSLTVVHLRYNFWNEVLEFLVLCLEGVVKARLRRIKMLRLFLLDHISNLFFHFELYFNLFNLHFVNFDVLGSI